MAFLVVVFCIFIMGGGFYNLLKNPPSTIALGGGFSSLHPYPSEQTSTEAWVVMMLNGLAVLGFYSAHRSTRILYDRGSANRWLVGGIFLILVGFWGQYLLLRVKLGLL